MIYFNRTNDIRIVEKYSLYYNCTFQFINKYRLFYCNSSLYFMFIPKVILAVNITVKMQGDGVFINYEITELFTINFTLPIMLFVINKIAIVKIQSFSNQTKRPFNA